MKKLFLTLAIIGGCLLFNNANAQVRVNLGLNIGDQPEWGPVGYQHAEFYYLPSIDAYYNIHTHRWIYWDARTGWTWNRVLPQGKAQHFDRYHAYKAVINEPNPWQRNDHWKAMYGRFSGRNDQPMIRDSRDEQYRNHWVEH